MKYLYQELIELGAYLSKMGYSVGSAGNLSVRFDENHILCTPTNANLGTLQQDEISLISLDDNRLVKGKPPTKEVSFHQAIYQKYPHAHSVIHLHSSYLTALSCLQNLNPQNVIKAFTPYVVMRVGDVPLIPYHTPGSPKIAKEVTKLPSHISAFLMANHGVSVFGSNINDARNKFEELEETAKLYFLLRNQDVSYLTKEEIYQLKEKKS
ncbi:MAG: aldolase [Alphaproteobacteria bacterium]